LAAHDDATAEQHCQLWAATSGQQASIATMRRAIRRLGWTRKKSRSLPPSAAKQIAQHGVT
jgi:transposase